MAESSNGSVTFSQGVTINLGNFESLRLDVSITVPVGTNDNPTADDAMATAVEFVDRNLAEQMAQAGHSPDAMSDTPKPKTTKKKVVRKKR